MKEVYYKVAGHVFVLETDGNEDAVNQLRQYDAFVTEPTDDTVFRLQILNTSLTPEGFHEEMRQQDEGQ